MVLEKLCLNLVLYPQEDLLIHGDSVYDIIDKQDHASIQSELMRSSLGSNSSSSANDNSAAASLQHSLQQQMQQQPERRIFLCRMNVSRNSRRQMRFGDQKVSGFLESNNKIKVAYFNLNHGSYTMARKWGKNVVLRSSNSVFSCLQIGNEV